jgi:diguanylate cyclase (GGDEF)-like protein
MGKEVNHNGVLTPDSASVTGAHTVTLGFAKSTLRGEAASSGETASAHTALYVLIVEDNRDLRDVVARMVQSLGHQVTVASTGKEALRQVHEHLPDIVLLDVMMPEMDGFEFCQVLQGREELQDCHIIITSARDTLEDKVKGLELGAADYLTKPFSLAELRARLQVGERLVRQRKLIRDQQVHLEHLARIDTLTGLLNRRRFDERLEEEWQRAARYERPLALLLCDIDHFKKVNDSYGHASGDVVLREVGQLLLHGSRTTDVVARYGGEEFVVLLCETEYEQAVLVANRLRAAVRELSLPHAAGPSSVSISIGVTELREACAESPTQLVAQADEALYTAKGLGRDRVECYKRT